MGRRAFVRTVVIGWVAMSTMLLGTAAWVMTPLPRGLTTPTDSAGVRLYKNP